MVFFYFLRKPGAEMVGTSPKLRQIVVTDPLWKVFSEMADRSGHKVDALINQAMFEMAIRLGYVKPVAREVALPIDHVSQSVGIAGKTSTGRTVTGQRAALGRMRENTSPGGVPPPGVRSSKPPRLTSKSSPGRVKMGSNELYIVDQEGSSDKVDKDIFIIGRSSKCDLVINSVKVSREHAIITKEQEGYFIEDLGSANGTWYKGEKIEKMKIRDGDEIFICDEKFKFTLH